MNHLKTSNSYHRGGGGLPNSKFQSKADLISIATEEDFEKHELKRKTQSGFLLREISNISKIMSTTKGRDKICGIMQY
jgi:hypothetical protein